MSASAGKITYSPHISHNDPGISEIIACNLNSNKNTEPTACYHWASFSDVYHYVKTSVIVTFITVFSSKNKIQYYHSNCILSNETETSIQEMRLKFSHHWRFRVWFSGFWDVFHRGSKLHKLKGIFLKSVVWRFLFVWKSFITAH